MSNIAIRKKHADERKNTCGVRLDDGMVRVAKMRRNMDAMLKRVENFGYRVFETNVPEGYYEESDFDKKHKPAGDDAPKGEGHGENTQAARSADAQA